MQVLEKKPANMKALFRKATALQQVGDILEAKKTLEVALSLDATDADCVAAMRRVKVQMKEETRRDSKVYGAMFSKVGSLYKDVPMPLPNPVAARDPEEPAYEGERVDAAAERSEGVTVTDEAGPSHA